MQEWIGTGASVESLAVHLGADFDSLFAMKLALKHVGPRGCVTLDVLVDKFKMKEHQFARAFSAEFSLKSLGSVASGDPEATRKAGIVYTVLSRYGFSNAQHFLFFPKYTPAEWTDTIGVLVSVVRKIPSEFYTELGWNHAQLSLLRNTNVFF